MDEPMIATGRLLFDYRWVAAAAGRAPKHSLRLLAYGYGGGSVCVGGGTAVACPVFAHRGVLRARGGEGDMELSQGDRLPEQRMRDTCG